VRREVRERKNEVESGRRRESGAPANMSEISEIKTKSM
jgi:hypothetical protein